MNKRCLASFACFTCLLFSLTGCQKPASEQKMVQIGTTKADLFGLPAEYRALHPRLENTLKSQVVFRPQPNGEAIAEQLEQGQIAFGFLTAKEYCSIKNPSKLTLIATALNKAGKPSRKAFIVTKANLTSKTIQDCASKRFAFGTYRDLLTDKVTQKTLEQAGVPMRKILIEVLPPPLAFEGRLYRQHDVAITVINDLTVNAGVIDEIDYGAMPETGGNIIIGPSKDQLRIIGETVQVPEMVVVAGPSADPKETALLKTFLLNEVKNDKRICEQLEVTGFTEPDRAAYDVVRGILANGDTSDKAAMTGE